MTHGCKEEALIEERRLAQALSEEGGEEEIVEGFAKELCQESIEEALHVGTAFRGRA